MNCRRVLVVVYSMPRKMMWASYLDLPLLLWGRRFQRMETPLHHPLLPATMWILRRVITCSTIRFHYDTSLLPMVVVVGQLHDRARKILLLRTRGWMETNDSRTANDKPKNPRHGAEPCHCKSMWVAQFSIWLWYITRKGSFAGNEKFWKALQSCISRQAFCCAGR